MQSADSPRQIAQTLPRGAKKFLAAEHRFLFASGKNIGIMILYENLGFCACAQDAEIFKKRGSYDMIPHGKEIKVFTGSSNPDLADMICKNLGISLGKSTVTAFADGECSISINEPVRGVDVFIVQSTCKPVNDSLMAVSCLAEVGVLTAMGDGLNTIFEGNHYLVTGIIGVLSSIVDNVPLVAGCMGMYPVAAAGDMAVDGIFWQLLAYCAGVGGSMLIIGSAAGVVVMGLEKITFGWYMKRITWIAFVGYLAGIVSYYFIRTFVF